MCYHLQHMFHFTKTKAAEFAGIMIGRSDRTVRQWQSEFHEHGEIKDSCQGIGAAFCGEVRNSMTRLLNSCVKGQPNMRAATFCLWVNDDLLPNITLEPGFPRRISVETAAKLLHRLSLRSYHQAKGSTSTATSKVMLWKLKVNSSHCVPLASCILSKLLLQKQLLLFQTTSH